MVERPGLETTAMLAGGSDTLGVRLVVLGEGTFATHLLPEKGELAIGRSDAADICVDHPSISRRHALLVMGPTPTISDLGSANGTKVNGVPVGADGHAIKPGEWIELGAVTMVLQSLLHPKTASLEKPRALTEIAYGAEMKGVLALIDRVSQGTISILLLGETGVGKEVLAERVHQSSPRRDRPFVRINCGAFSESLLEAELFGYEKGAFTGATKTKPGLIETAHEGTVLLDEVGDMPMPLQLKLLRVIEQKQVLRVGSVEPRDVDARFVAATNCDLEAHVKQGKFRLDLLYRLNGATIRVPPLRERKTEIVGLAQRFLRATCQQLGIADLDLPDHTIAALEGHDWPGNVRELRNVVERAALLADGKTIEPRHLGLSKTTSTSLAGDDDDDDPERKRVLEAMEKFGGNQTRAAKHLGMARGTLIKRLEQYGVQRPRPKE